MGSRLCASAWLGPYAHDEKVRASNLSQGQYVGEIVFSAGLNRPMGTPKQ